MRPPKPVPPAGIETLGLRWRPRKTHWLGYWIARQDFAGEGYPIKSRFLWSTEAQPTLTLENWQELSTACAVLQGEMLNWGKVETGTFDATKLFDGTISSLIDIYLKDPDSPYQSLRYQASITYARWLEIIRQSIGTTRISTLTFRDFKRMYEGWRTPTKPNEPDRISYAYEHIKFLRIVFSFGALLKLPGCADAKGVLGAMEFENTKSRIEIVNSEQSALIRKGAHAVKLGSIAFAQALQHDLMARQKDVIGELIPNSHPGTSDVQMGDFKWVGGFRWERLDSSFRLTHRISKSLRGRRALVSPDAGKVMTWNLWLYPSVIEELCLMAGVSLVELRRDLFPASGPMVIAEHSRKPWRPKVFANKWREIARAMDIPDNVQNRDNRAFGATDAETKGADIEKIRKGLGHSKPETTRIYTRANEEATAEIAHIRFGKPAKDA
jgi:hypothetical protein